MPRTYVSRTPTCHPERKHCALGLCSTCYSKKRDKETGDGKTRTKRYREKHRERLLKKANAAQKKRYATKEGWLAVRAWHLKKTYGLSCEDYELLWRFQNGLCAICRRPETTTRAGRIKLLAIDHDHLTGKMRGLLCQSCNAMIGYGRDNVELLQAAIGYLEKHGS